MKTDFDECEAAKPLAEKLWILRGSPAYWDTLRNCDSRVHLGPPAIEEEIKILREFVGGTLPPTLEEFLRVANGVRFDFNNVLLSTSGMIEETKRMHAETLYLPNEHLLFIGDLGDGDAFAFGKNKQGDWSSNVFWWDHENDSCYTCALGVWDYVGKHISWRSIYME